MGHFRLAIAGVFATALLLSVSATAVLATPPSTAAIVSKSIDTTTGECIKDSDGNPVLVGGGECGAAVYGTDGFSGRIYGSRAGLVVDYLCVHTPGDSAFVSYPGTYTFTIYDASHAIIASATETVTGGQDCNNGNNAVTSGSVFIDFAANGGVVYYTISISGVTSSNAVATFAAYNSILNRVIALDSNAVNSASVAPPAPVAEVPEAPLPALLVLTAGLTGLVYVSRRRPRTS